jgi:hypothetical protein
LAAPFEPPQATESNETVAVVAEVKRPEAFQLKTERELPTLPRT